MGNKAWQRKRRLIAATGMLVASQAFACDVADKKCVAVNSILSKLEYREKLLEAQRGCKINADDRSPDSLAKKGVMRVLGIKKTDAGWNGLMEAHERFVSASCGGEEVVQVVLNIYRNEWRTALSESELARLAEPGVPIDAQAKVGPTNAARAKAALVINAMQARAAEEYEQEISELAGGGAKAGDACPGGEVDERTKSCKTKK